MNISNLSQFEKLSSNILSNQADFAAKQTQVTTGKKYVYRSEDTAAASEAADIHIQDRNAEQFLTNTQNATNYQIASNGKVQETVELLQSSLELMIDAKNGTHPPEHRKNLAFSLDAIIEQLQQVSSSKLGENYLFGGTMSRTAPFTATRDATTGQITSVSANADANTSYRQMQLDSDTIVNVGELASGTDGLFQASSTGVDLIANLIAIRDELALGDIPSDANHGVLETNLDHAIGKITSTGIKQQWLMGHESSLIQTRENHVRQLNTLESLDMSEALLELSQLQTAFQASLQMAVRNDQMNILKYI